MQPCSSSLHLEDDDSKECKPTIQMVKLHGKLDHCMRLLSETMLEAPSENHGILFLRMGGRVSLSSDCQLHHDPQLVTFDIQLIRFGRFE